MSPKVKTLDTTYIIKVNNNILLGLATLKEAKEYVKYMQLNETIKEIKIVKKTTTEQILKSYTPLIKIALKAIDLDGELHAN